MMTRILSAVLIGTAFFAAPAFAATALAATPTQISITGQGHAAAPPDMATMSLQITTNSDDGSAATSENNTIYNRLIQSLASLGIAASDIHTGYYNLNYTPRPVNAAAVAYAQQFGYTVSRSVSVTINHTDTVGKAVDAAVAAGVNHVQGVSFGVADNHMLVMKALADAVSQARAKAQAIAQAAGLKLGRVRYIQEGFSSVPYQLTTIAAVRSISPVPTQIAPSDVSVQAAVTITYEASP